MLTTRVLRYIAIAVVIERFNIETGAGSLEHCIDRRHLGMEPGQHKIGIRCLSKLLMPARSRLSTDPAFFCFRIAAHIPVPFRVARLLAIAIQPLAYEWHIPQIGLAEWRCGHICFC